MKKDKNTNAELIIIKAEFDIRPELEKPTKFEEKSNTDKLIPEGPSFSIKPLSIDRNVDP